MRLPLLAATQKEKQQRVNMAQAALKARKRSDYGFMLDYRTRW